MIYRSAPFLMTLNDPYPSFKVTLLFDAEYLRIYLSIYQGNVSALCLLDLTAAFDTVDHDLLLLRPERQFGLCGVILQWFSSYLSDRTFQVVFRSGMSSVVIITCSVPQGSVLGPRLYILYTADLADVIKAHNASFQCYVDDSQLYLRCQRQHMTTAGNKLKFAYGRVRIRLGRPYA